MIKLCRSRLSGGIAPHWRQFEPKLRTIGFDPLVAEVECSIIQERVRAGLERARRERASGSAGLVAPELCTRILDALKAPGRPGVRKIADQFGVNALTVQQISRGTATLPRTG